MTLERYTRPNPLLVAGAFLVSGAIHLVRPSFFEPLIPSAMPRPREIVYVSGVAELVCAAGLLTKARWAGPATAAVLLGVWPGNLQMAMDYTAKARRTGKPLHVAMAAGAWARMPAQIPLVRSALSAGRRSE